MRSVCVLVSFLAVVVAAVGCSSDEEGVSSNAGGAAGNGGAGATGGSTSGGSSGSAGTGGASGAATTIAFPDLAIDVSEGSLVQKRAGTPFVPRQAVSCCGGGYGWPLVDHAWIDLVAGYGINWVHIRLGPWRTVAGGEDEWASVGGAYQETGGLAQLDQFNPAFWSAVEDILEYAGQKGLRVEVDVADGWGLKHAEADDLGPNWPYHPWSAWNNSSDTDYVAAAGTQEIPAGSLYDVWVRKVAEHTCKYGNVTLEDGNEINLKSGYAPAWSQSIGNVYWDECAKRGYLLDGAPFRPLLGTQSGDAATIAAPQIAYSEWHQDGPIPAASCGSKPCGVNEYNPDPPLTPAQLAANVCSAEASGTWFAYWRHGQDDTAMTETLSLMAQGCGG